MCFGLGEGYRYGEWDGLEHVLYAGDEAFVFLGFELPLGDGGGVKAIRDDVNWSWV